MTYNVWGFPGWLSSAPPTRFRFIGDELGRRRPDVVALQEVWCDDACDAIPGGPEWSVARGRHEWFVFHKNGLVTATPHDILEAQSYHFRDEAGLPSYFNSKGALYAAIEFPDGSVGLVWNTHMQAGEEGGRVRYRQAAQLVQWMEEALERWTRSHPEQRPFVCLLGDLNCTPDSLPYRLLYDWLADYGPIGASTELAPTYDYTLNDWAAVEAPRAIDHGLVAGDAVFGFRARRLFTERHSSLGRHLSDHVAAEIAFSLQPDLLAMRSRGRARDGNVH